MISARIVKEAEGYIVEARTYSADVSATGKPLTMYEVTNADCSVFDTFCELEKAVEFMENQIAWKNLINSLPPHSQIVA